MIVKALVVKGYEVHELVTVNEILRVALISISKGPTVLTVTKLSQPLLSLANVQPVKLLSPFRITQSSELNALVNILLGTEILMVSVLNILICVGFNAKVRVLTAATREELACTPTDSGYSRMGGEIDAFDY